MIFNGDCLDIMPTLADKSIDLTVTSPPYDNLRTYNGSLEWSFGIFQAIAKELFRVTKDGGVVVWVVGDATINGSETGTSFKQALYFKEIGFNLHDTMIYQKDNPPPVGGNNRYYQHFEYMLVFSKGFLRTFHPITTIRRNKWEDKRTERYKGFTRDKEGNFTKKNVSLCGDVKIGNIWKYVVGGGSSVEYGTGHPAAFPEQLATDHILSWSNEGDTVLDPFAGSGTTGVACLNTGRKFILIEKDVKYCEIIRKRIADHDPLFANLSTVGQGNHSTKGRVKNEKMPDLCN
jgi:DNA modification methylase